MRHRTAPPIAERQAPASFSYTAFACMTASGSSHPRAARISVIVSPGRQVSDRCTSATTRAFPSPRTAGGSRQCWSVVTAVDTLGATRSTCWGKASRPQALDSTARPYSAGLGMSRCFGIPPSVHTFGAPWSQRGMRHVRMMHALNDIIFIMRTTSEASARRSLDRVRPPLEVDVLGLLPPAVP